MSDYINKVIEDCLDGIFDEIEVACTEMKSYVEKSFDEDQENIIEVANGLSARLKGYGFDVTTLTENCGNRLHVKIECKGPCKTFVEIKTMSVSV